MEKGNMVTTRLSREQFRSLWLAKMDSVGSEKLAESIFDLRARSIFILVKVIISLVGKEKAKELIEEAQYSNFYKRGKEAAEKVGNPTDVDSFLELKGGGLLGNLPFLTPPEIVEKTKNRLVTTCTRCLEAESLLKVGAGDPETLEVAKYCCPHDTAWANGFFPNMKFQRTKFLLDGDDCCEFVAESE